MFSPKTHFRLAYQEPNIPPEKHQLLVTRDFIHNLTTLKYTGCGFGYDDVFWKDLGPNLTNLEVADLNVPKPFTSHEFFKFLPDSLTCLRLEPRCNWECHTKKLPLEFPPKLVELKLFGTGLIKLAKRGLPPSLTKLTLENNPSGAQQLVPWEYLPRDLRWLETDHWPKTTEMDISAPNLSILSLSHSLALTSDQVAALPRTLNQLDNAKAFSSITDENIMAWSLPPLLTSATSLLADNNLTTPAGISLLPRQLTELNLHKLDRSMIPCLPSGLSTLDVGEIVCDTKEDYKQMNDLFPPQVTALRFGHKSATPSAIPDVIYFSPQLQLLSECSNMSISIIVPTKMIDCNKNKNCVNKKEPLKQKKDYRSLQ